MSEMVTIQRIGERCGILVPQEHLDKLGWKEGDQVEIRSNGDHIEFLPPHPDEAEEQNRADFSAGTAMKNYYAALRELAKH